MSVVNIITAVANLEQLFSWALLLQGFCSSSKMFLLALYLSKADSLQAEDKPQSFWQLKQGKQHIQGLDHQP